MKGLRRFIIAVALAGLVVAVLPQIVSAYHWIPDIQVSVAPGQAKASRTVLFQVIVQNSGASTVTICRVDIQFGWNLGPQNVFVGSHDLLAGGTKTWETSEDIPDVEPGFYSETVTITGTTLALPPDLTCDPNDWPGTLQIVANQPPEAAFSYSPPTPAPDADVYFSDASSDLDGTVEAWQWDFGGGALSNDRNPTHQFTDPGSHLVVLTVTDSDGAMDAVSHTVQVLPNSSPVSAFSFSPGLANTSTVIQFSDQSSDPDGSVVSWRWDFDDGTSSNDQNPIHRFHAAGVYHVTLTVTDNDGSTSRVTQNVEVVAVPSANGPGVSGFGIIAWGTVAAAIAAIGIVGLLIVKRKLFRRPRRWGQAGNQNSNGSKSRWRPP
jgi:PKD repeat protein